MVVTRILAVALVAAALCSGATALADTLLVTSVDAAQASATERPARGTSMASVETRFGPASTRSSAVGRPPITRWDYPDFTVFFEFDHVVHSVRR
jgi:hypothetical protein